MTPAASDPQRVAAQVVELGHALFDALLDAAARPPEPAQPFPEAEMREAAETFFQALRQLLKLDEGQEARR